MLNVLCRLQFTMVVITAVMIVATGVSAVDMSKRRRLLDGIVTGTTIADVGDMMSTISHLQNALLVREVRGDGPVRARMLDAIRSQLAAMKVGEADKVEQSPEEQAARIALSGAVLDLQLLAIDEAVPGMRAKLEAILRDMQQALQTLALEATGSLKKSVAGDLSLTDAALRLHLTLLAVTVLCGI